VLVRLVAEVKAAYDGLGDAILSSIIDDLLALDAGRAA
jgi:hypothetical protein